MTTPIRILVVDDDADLLRATCHTLTQAGFVTLAVATGAEVLPVLREQSAHLVLLDRQLPDVDGLEICRQIKADPALAGVFVVLTSGIRKGSEERVAGLEALADGYIERPVSSRELLARVESFVRIVRLNQSLSDQAEALREQQIKLEAQNKDLRRAQAELDVERARYLDLYQFAPVGYLTITEPGVILQANLTAANLLGAARRGLSKQLLSRFILRDDLDTYRLHLQKVLETGILHECELRMVNSDGYTFWARLVTTTALVADGGRVFRVVLSDNTERRRAEAALHAVEERHQLILQQAMDGFCELDHQGCILEVNEVYCQMSGYSSSELLAMRISDLEDAETAASTAAHLQLLMVQGKDRFESRHRRKDGSTFEVEVSAQYRPVDGGRFVGFMRDITARKQAEAALRDAHWRMGSVIEGTRVGTWEWNVQTGAVVFNERWAEIVGYKLAELAPVSIKTWEALAHAEDMKQSGDLLGRHFAGELPDYDCECRMKHKDGGWVWVHDRGRLVTRTADGQPLMMFGTHADITARKQAEAALRASESRLRTLVDANPESFFLMDPAGIVLVANEVVARRLGRPRDELLGTNIFDLLPPALAQRRRAQVDEAARVGGLLRFDDVRFGASIDNYVHPVWDEAGQLSGFAILGVDTTQRRQAEAALRENEVRYRTLADGGQALIWTSGLDKKCDYFNQRWFAFTGRTFEQEQGDGWTQGVHPEDQDRCFAIYSKAFDRRERFSMDYRLRRHDGEYRWIQDDGMPRYDSQGNFLGYIGHCLDITERKRAAEDLLQFQEQLRALSARQSTLREEERTRIAREIHDELGQLLTGLKMDLHFAENLVSDMNDTRLNPLLDKLVAATELADATILTVQRIASELRPGVLDRLGLIMALHYEANQFKRRSGLRCDVTLPKEEPSLSPEVATAFFRIFQEALTNTARHASAKSIQASFRADADHWVLEVQDDGQGIADAELTNPHSLGLLGMQERARLLDGTVTFGRTATGGTVVTVRLPRREDSPTYML